MRTTQTEIAEWQRIPSQRVKQTRPTTNAHLLLLPAGTEKSTLYAILIRTRKILYITTIFSNLILTAAEITQYLNENTQLNQVRLDKMNMFSTRKSIVSSLLLQHIHVICGLVYHLFTYKHFQNAYLFRKRLKNKSDSTDSNQTITAQPFTTNCAGALVHNFTTRFSQISDSNTLSLVSSPEVHSPIYY